jgi:hypothetical protein
VKIKNIVLLLLFVFLIQSCMTQRVWQKTDPDEYVQISMKEFSEDEIKAKNIKYYKNDKEKVYYIEKSNLRKLGDYSLRLLLTPITVPIDAATYIVVIAVLMHMPMQTPKDVCEKNMDCRVSAAPSGNGGWSVVGGAEYLNRLTEKVDEMCMKSDGFRRVTLPDMMHDMQNVRK